MAGARFDRVKSGAPDSHVGAVWVELLGFGRTGRSPR